MPEMTKNVPLIETLL